MASLAAKSQINNTFENAMNEIFGTLNKNSLAPTFAFIDPFGTKGVPFEIVKTIMSYKKCEVFFNYMHSGVVRSTHNTDHTGLFGTDHWRNFIELSPAKKHDAFLGLYADQLKNEAKVKYIRSFNVRNKMNATIFDLIYATNNEVGLDKMKSAMWKADPLGNFTFRDRTNPGQLVLFEDEPDLEPLKKELLDTFAGKVIDIDKIIHHVLVNTPYLSTHVKRKTLQPLAKNGIIEVKRPLGSSSGFKEGTLIKFPQK
ncbi:three-Cys-motif partner protein TcmP [Paenibacillus elgii]